jgi:hypothetical protein
MYFWRRPGRTFRILKVVHEVIREDVRVTQAILERMDNNVLKWHVRVLQLVGKLWAKWILTWWAEGETESEVRNEVRKWSGRSDETEES